MPSLTPAQIRGARAMLDWSMMDLSRAAGVSVSTIKRVEDSGMAATPTAMVKMIRQALESGGVLFLADEGNGPGLILRPR